MNSSLRICSYFLWSQRTSPEILRIHESTFQEQEWYVDKIADIRLIFRIHKQKEKKLSIRGWLKSDQAKGITQYFGNIYDEKIIKIRTWELNSKEIVGKLGFLKGYKNKLCLWKMWRKGKVKRFVEERKVEKLLSLKIDLFFKISRISSRFSKS